jgi:hypothetical protein
VLSSIFQTIIDVQHSMCSHKGGGGDGCHHAVPIVQVASAAASSQLNASRASAANATTMRVHLLKEYEKPHPELHAQVADKLRLANVEVLSSPEEGVPLVVLLSPEILRDATLRSRLEALLRTDEDGVMASAVYLYSTAVPFDYYLKHCPQELKDLGLFSHMYEKFPRSLLLQKAAASLVADRLLDSMAGVGEEGARGNAQGLLCVRAVLRWIRKAPARRGAQRDNEKPSRRLLYATDPPPSRKGPPGLVALPSGKTGMFSGKGRAGELSMLRERANTEDV